MLAAMRQVVATQFIVAMQRSTRLDARPLPDTTAPVDAGNDRRPYRPLRCASAPAARGTAASFAPRDAKCKSCVTTGGLPSRTAFPSKTPITLQWC